MTDRLTSLIALEALGLLNERISAGVRVHLRACEACRMEWHELRTRSEMFELDARSGAARTVRAARALILQTRRDAHAISDCAFVECEPGVRWSVAGENGVTVVYRIISPLASRRPLSARYGQTKVGIVLEGSVTITYPDRASQRLGVWDAYTVSAGVAHAEEFHERTLLFEVYTPRHLEYEESYRRQAQRRGSC